MIKYINNMSWNIFENHFIKQKSENNKLLMDCMENKITMSAMFDLFITNNNNNNYGEITKKTYYYIIHCQLLRF